MLYGAARRRPWRLDVGCLALLAALACGFHWRVLSAEAHAPAGGGDLASFLYPYYAFAARELRAGRVPLWNPYVFSGMPFVGDVQSGLFYPLNLAQFALDPALSYQDMEALAVLHLWLAGCGMFLLLRRLPGTRLSAWPALLGAVAFMFSDLFILHFGNLNLIAGAAWLPFAVLLLSQALAWHSSARALLAGLFLGLCGLAGHLQPLLYNALALALVVLCQALRAWSLRNAGRCLALLALALAAGASVSAPATLPALALAGHTTRADFTYWEAERYSLTPLRALGLLLPELTGRDPRSYWGLGDRVESGYVGLLPLALALYAAWRCRHRLRALALVLAGAFFALALGNTTPLHGWLYLLLPGMSLLRAPARALYVVDFALAALAALGLASWPQEPEAAARRYVRALGFFGAALLSLLLASSFLATLLLQDRDPVLFARAWQAAGAAARAGLFLLPSLLLLWAGRGAHWQWAAAAVLLTYMDLASVGAYCDLGREDPARGFQHAPAVAFLRSDPGQFRVDAAPEAAGSWQPNMGMLCGLSHIRGVANPMALSRYERFLQLAGDRRSALYNLLGAKYLVIPKGQDPGDERFQPVFAGDPQVDIYLNTQAAPLAFIAHAACWASDPESAAAMLAGMGGAALSCPVLEGQGPAPEPAVGQEWVALEQLGTDELLAHASLSSAGYLYLAVPLAPGWRASLDGQPVRPVPANLAFMAFHIGPGLHELRLRYWPPLFLPALGLAAAAALAIGAAAKLGSGPASKR